MYKRILVPVDGSPTAQRGLAEAVALAMDQHAALRVLHVVDDTMLLANFAGVMDVGELIDMLREGGERILADARDRTTASGLAAELVLRETMGSRVASVILKEAQEWRADLIVMGTHGRRGVSHLVLGSDAEAVLRASGLPVLLVRTPQDAASPAA